MNVFRNSWLVCVSLSAFSSAESLAQQDPIVSVMTPIAASTASPTPLPATKLTKATPKPEDHEKGLQPITRIQLCLSNDETSICTSDDNSDIVLPALQPQFNNYKISLSARSIRGEAPIKAIRFNIARGTECKQAVGTHDRQFIEDSVMKSLDGMEVTENQVHPSTLCGFHAADRLEHYCPLPFGGPLYDYLQAKPLKRPFPPPLNDSDALQRNCKGSESEPAKGYLAMRLETQTAVQDENLKKFPGVYAVKVCIASFGQHSAKVCTPFAVANSKTTHSAGFHFDPRVPNGVVSSIVIKGR